MSPLSVVCLGDLADHLGLDAAEQAAGPRFRRERAAADAVDGVPAAVVGAQPCAAVVAFVVGRIFVHVGQELVEFVLSDEHFAERRPEFPAGVVAQHFLQGFDGGALDEDSDRAAASSAPARSRRRLPSRRRARLCSAFQSSCALISSISIGLVVSGDDRRLQHAGRPDDGAPQPGLLRSSPSRCASAGSSIPR